jgi:hypothetical protein
VQRLAVIAKLKPDGESRATELIEKGPPFNPRDTPFDRHAVYLSGDEAVFVFEGGRLDQLLQSVIKNPAAEGAFREWESIVEGMPSVARETYFWERGDEWPEAWGGSLL